MPGCFRALLLTLLICVLASVKFVAQPLLPSKQEVAGLTVYKDLKSKYIYYYAPGKLRLATDKLGRPGFQLVQMRYTGTGASGNQGEKRFLNIVQVVIWMEQPEGTQLKEVQTQLGGARIKLEPIPVQNIDAFLVLPMGDSDGRYRKIGKSGGLEGADAKSGYWTERAFTVRLENHEAQLLWDQVEKGRLAMSLSYAFHAEAISDIEGSYKVSGDRDMAKELKEELDQLMQIDSTAAVQVFHSGAFPIEVDPKIWPDLMRKIDINDEAPPAWAALEVRCYDFANELRPDLGMKAIEIEASGVQDEPVRITGKRFLSSKPDQNTLQIKFPYAVKLTKPYRYRVIEFTEEGTRTTLPWINRDNWAEVLDITTPPGQNKLEVHELEIELATDFYENTEADEVEVVFIFQQKGAAKLLKLRWEKDGDTFLKTLRFYADKAEPVQYYTKWKDAEAWRHSPKKLVGSDDYIYLKIE